MFTGKYVPPQYEVVRDSNEQFIWVGKSEFIPFILLGVPMLLLGLAWGSFDYFVFIRSMAHAGIPSFVLLFFLLHMMPCWVGIGNFIRLFRVYRNTYYAVTNKRIMMRSGFLGIDFKSIDVDRISDLEVNVNPIEYLFNVGTVRGFARRDANPAAPISPQRITVSFRFTTPTRSLN